MLPFWDDFRTRPIAQAAMRGTNAALVGILGAALYEPVWTGAIFSSYDGRARPTGFVRFTVWKAPRWLVVVMVAIG